MNAYTAVKAAEVEAEASVARPTEDQELLRAAGKIARDLGKPNPAIYYTDLLACVILGYGALALTIATAGVWLKLAFGAFAVLALYRALGFIHELSHLNPRAMPGFRRFWNLIVGVPLMIPSFMYEGVHNIHHSRTRYGTAGDPEYLPLALMPPRMLALFLLASALAPVGLLLRYGILAPLSLLSPRFRHIVVERYSSLVINPAFRRDPKERMAHKDWPLWETLTSLYAIGWLALTATGVVHWSVLMTVMAVISGVAVLNQVRTLVAHLWENEGEPMTLTEQFLDSANVPPPNPLAALWAPVGLRYHAMHHLLPSVPYHNLGKAHRALMQQFGTRGTYNRANYTGLWVLCRNLVSSSFRKARGQAGS
ncbi:fatty acid desaturase family protein [Pedomonas sp. V897]|uniref:fatty acid desaturase family protein n=1 Tax=Pedomonas sp. V897 TaxID=3446482 RepID=UPI003EE08303